MSLTPEKLRAKFLRDYPKMDVVYEQSAGSEFLMVLPAGRIKELFAEDETFLNELQEKMPQGIDLRRMFNRIHEMGGKVLLIIIEAETS